MHSHLIPGIDDGSPSMQATIEMLKGFVDLGYEKVITTPHIMFDFYKNTPKIIRDGLADVQNEIRNQQIPITLEAAAEYYFDEHFLSLIDKDELLTFGNRHLLFEFSFRTKPNGVDEVVFELKSKGYQPILAHYERYLFFLSDGVKPAEKLKSKGVEIQMNLNSLTGYYGQKVKRQAELLVDANLIDYLGTDCHRLVHLEMIKANLDSKYFRKLNEMTFKNADLY
ncbi:capsular biosynthesis protein [Brumimicrobium salinarum]|uniref:protein-tyrosine-phosphatase n=2 Tax=Brumimicrobium salinarum TaxID=2058658 RepID=A0A2I0R3B1_9FLAO|nr:capsular biosynthesis protein [Brumimicrobium salinarum]